MRMRLEVKVMVAAVLLLVTGAGGAWAEPLLAGADQLFRLDWQASQGRGGQPVVEGYVLNTGRYQAERMQVQVEGLDGSGRVVHTTTAYVMGAISPGQQGYFRLAAPAAQTYRVQVLWVDWSRCGDG